MKQSSWLQNFEKTENEIRNKKKAPVKKWFGISFATIAVGILIFNLFPEDICYLSGGLFITFGVLALFFTCIVNMGIVNFIPDTQISVRYLLQSDQEVERFDREMSKAPINEFWINRPYSWVPTIETSYYMFETENYIGVRAEQKGQQGYWFMRKQDIAFIERTVSDNDYLVRIYNSEKKHKLEILVGKKNELNQVIEILTKIKPEVQIEVNETFLNKIFEV